MDLSAADRQLDTDPQKARVLMAEAMVQSREALEELRALSRGFAPPILLDRGLVAALESLTVRSPVPIRFVNELTVGVDLPQEIERNAYFVASELLTNVAKHASATDVELRIALRRVAEPDSTWLDVTVTDNGTGGAAVTEGHGLAGLDERVRGLGGILAVSSPVGGPTRVSAHLPVTY
jgi:signal transduction histidine kinase